MSDFWAHLGPWLLMAALLPASIVAWLLLIPGDEWVDRVVRDWADSEALRLSAIDEVLLFKRFARSKHYRVFRITVLDRKGRERVCKAVVGRFLLWRTRRNIAITWIKPR